MGDADVTFSLGAVRRDIADAARRAGRDPQSVKLIAVSKTVPEHAIEEAIGLGQRRFGENRVQEAKAKWPALKERHPDLERHPVEGVAVLRAQGWPEDVCRAVLSHADHTGVVRETPMERALFACDELCGFLVACSLVTPGRTLAEVEVPGVRKKMKRADFARNVNRDDIVNGAAALGVELDEHITFVLDAMRGIHAELGL